MGRRRPCHPSKPSVNIWKLQYRSHQYFRVIVCIIIQIFASVGGLLITTKKLCNYFNRNCNKHQPNGIDEENRRLICWQIVLRCSCYTNDVIVAMVSIYLLVFILLFVWGGHCKNAISYWIRVVWRTDNSNSPFFQPAVARVHTTLMNVWILNTKRYCTTELLQISNERMNEKK